MRPSRLNPPAKTQQNLQLVLHLVLLDCSPDTCTYPDCAEINVRKNVAFQ